ncbi:MAG: cyclic lactone autoinducer peptide [Clostridia bacterium]|nr:cyclic lactone autoinducer peptide [Clostridia bacterium]
MKVTKIITKALSALMAFVAVVFASMPCLGPIYEPEVPDELME